MHPHLGDLMRTVERHARSCAAGRRQPNAWFLRPRSGVAAGRSREPMNDMDGVDSRVKFTASRGADLGPRAGSDAMSDLALDVTLAEWQLAACDAWQTGDGVGAFRGTLEIFTGGG